MRSDYRCFFCVARAFERLLEKESISAEAKSSFTRDMARLYYNYAGTSAGPDFSRDLHRSLQNYTNNPDPYREAKKASNDLALRRYPELKKSLERSVSPSLTALRLALAGNIIDFAARSEFDIDLAINDALNSQLSIDHSQQLFRTLSDSKLVLYLGDNAGEIVFDRLFIETLNHPNLVYAVRGGPVINDATMEDAEYTGMNRVTRVISTEYDAPSTIPHKSGKAFQKLFNDADLVISKGQGNLEGLLPFNDKRIFFLLMVKCSVIAEQLKVKKDSFVVFNNSFS